MLRRARLIGRGTSLLTASASAAATRTAFHKPTQHDWSAMWSRPLTEEEQAQVSAQSARTVSGVVPGEMFMRHWTAAEQSMLSVNNRVVGGIVAVFLLIWASGYATLGYNGHNCAHTAGWIFIAYWLILLEFHQMWMMPVAVSAAFLQLALN